MSKASSDGADDCAGDGQHGRLREQEKHGVAGDHDQLRMGEVDQPHDAEDEADAERGQRIEAAHADGVDQDLDGLPDHAGPAVAAMATPK